MVEVEVESGGRISGGENSVYLGSRRRSTLHHVPQIKLPAQTSISALITEEDALAKTPVNVNTTAAAAPKDPTLGLLSAQVDSLRKAVTWLLLKDTAPPLRLSYPQYQQAPLRYSVPPGGAYSGGSYNQGMAPAPGYYPQVGAGYAGDSWGGSVGPGGQGYYIRGSGAYTRGYYGGRGGYRYPRVGGYGGGFVNIDSGIRRMQYAALQSSEPPLLNDDVDLGQ